MASKIPAPTTPPLRQRSGPPLSAALSGDPEEAPRSTRGAASASGATRNSRTAAAPDKPAPNPRGGQVSIVLGTELRDRVDRVFRANATRYDTRADLMRDAITQLLDKLEKNH